ncbi:MAG: toxin-antitoxin system HicB family antitoxin [Gammaproteobacteria bacterium]|nr:toxin-antitoxin system HicB family antitoxin [Gammaproteobacteria bacterium]
MSTLSLRLPGSLYEQVKVLASQDGISVNQFISSAVAEKMSALMTEEFLLARAKTGNEGEFYRVLSKVPPTDPSEQDAL